MGAKADRAPLLNLGERARMDSEGKAAQGESREDALHRNITPQSGFRLRI